MSASLPCAFGPYSLIKLLARGGMGEIFLARTTGLAGFQKYCALKKLLHKFLHDRDVMARFVDEAKLGARLCHPNIVQVSDLGRVGDELYMAAEFVDGFDLRRILRFCHEKKRRIPLDTALFVVREVLSGLAYAHKQVDADGRKINLIHRDISPQNVLVSFEGEVKIIDFGLAKSTQRSQETQANVLLGNFGYMSPEQARGRKLDERTDVYSAGIVLFELLTGTKRFVDDNPLSLLEKVAHPAPLLPGERAPGVPHQVDALYARAVHPDLDHRFRDASEFRDEVTRVLHQINPRAAREHLAAFLEFLFLGGPAPAVPTFETDALNKSVSLVVKDVFGKSEAFTASKESDVGNRALAHFDDDMPQTESHPVMRAARVGDVLAENQLMFVDASVPTQSPESAPVAEVDSDPASRPPRLDALDLTEDEFISELPEEDAQTAIGQAPQSHQFADEMSQVNAEIQVAVVDSSTEAQRDRSGEEHLAVGQQFHLPSSYTDSSNQPLEPNAPEMPSQSRAESWVADSHEPAAGDNARQQSDVPIELEPVPLSSAALEEIVSEQSVSGANDSAVASDFEIDVEDLLEDAEIVPQTAVPAEAADIASPFDSEPVYESLVIDFDDLKELHKELAKDANQVPEVVAQVQIRPAAHVKPLLAVSAHPVELIHDSSAHDDLPTPRGIRPALPVRAPMLATRQESNDAGFSDKAAEHSSHRKKDGQVVIKRDETKGRDPHNDGKQS